MDDISVPMYLLVSPFSRILILFVLSAITVIS